MHQTSYSPVLSASLHLPVGVTPFGGGLGVNPPRPTLTGGGAGINPSTK